MSPLVLAVVLCAAPDPAAEATARGDALVNQGFNLTHSWTLDARKEKTTVSLEFFVPPTEREHTLSFWAEAPSGGFGFRLTGPGGQVRAAAFLGKRGESTSTFALPPGKYLLELERAADTGGHALFGVKGPVMRACKPEAEEHAANPAKGFAWPYLLYVPKQGAGRRLLVAPNNTGFVTEELELLRASGSCEVHRQAALAERLGTALLVPLFPRPPTQGEEENLYLHALSRSSLETKVEAYRRVDLQLLAMIDDARSAVSLSLRSGVGMSGEPPAGLSPRVLLTGFSASGSFVNRFAMLHPERVAAVACGSPGGWPLAPVAKAGADTLDYPVGIADVEKLTGAAVDQAALAKVSWFFFIGGQDQNDAVPFRDSFSKADEALLFRRFGKTPVARWKGAEALYQRAGLAARFSLYPGVGHQVTPQMEKDLEGFFSQVKPEP